MYVCIYIYTCVYNPTCCIYKRIERHHAVRPGWVALESPDDADLGVVVCDGAGVAAVVGVRDRLLARAFSSSANRDSI